MQSNTKMGDTLSQTSTLRNSKNLTHLTTIVVESPFSRKFAELKQNARNPFRLPGTCRASTLQDLFFQLQNQYSTDGQTRTF